MKTPFIPLLIISFLLSVTFGLSIMNHMGEQGHSRCPFETAGAVDCTRVQNPVGFAISHLNALSKSFSAIPVSSFVSLIAIYLLLALAAIIYLKNDFESFKLKVIFIRRHIYEYWVTPNKILLTYWLSLYENSPAFIPRR